MNTEGQSTNLEVTAYPNTLKAGFNTTITVSIYNDFEPIYDIDVSLSFSAPSSSSSTTTASTELPVLIGTSNWKFDKIEKGNSIAIEPLIFANKDYAGKAYSSYISISYKRLGYISTQSETHIVGFYVKGEIDILAYEFSVEPENVTAGSEIIITASLLNKGTVTASYTNASLSPNPILIQKLESYSYLGEVEPNSPAPFTLEAIVNSNTEEGDYTIKIIVEYEDEESKAYVLEKEVEVYVEAAAEEQGPRTTAELIVEFIKGYALFILIGMVIIIILITIRIRRRSTEEEFE